MSSSSSSYTIVGGDEWPMNGKCPYCAKRGTLGRVEFQSDALKKEHNAEKIEIQKCLDIACGQSPSSVLYVYPKKGQPTLPMFYTQLSFKRSK